MTKEEYIEQTLSRYLKLTAEDSEHIKNNPLKVLFNMKRFLEGVYDFGYNAGRKSLQSLETQN